MASVPTYQSNPYADFDPSQWSNPYSLFQNQALPWPTSYAGWPTDASGRPIQPTPGMTLNSQPQQQAAAPAAAPATQKPMFSQPEINWMRAQATPQQWGNNQMGIGGTGGDMTAKLMAMMNQKMGQQQPQAAAPPAPGANSAGLTADQYLQLRANPGQITTPGATVPQASSAQPGPGVLQQFMQNWRPQASGPGSGFTNNFYQALKAQGY
jgi:hypothetical protein